MEEAADEYCKNSQRGARAESFDRNLILPMESLMNLSNCMEIALSVMMVRLSVELAGWVTKQ